MSQSKQDPNDNSSMVENHSMCYSTLYDSGYCSREEVVPFQIHPTLFPSSKSQILEFDPLAARVTPEVIAKGSDISTQMHEEASSLDLRPTIPTVPPEDFLGDFSIIEPPADKILADTWLDRFQEEF